MPEKVPKSNFNNDELSKNIYEGFQRANAFNKEWTLLPLSQTDLFLRGSIKW